MPASPPAARTSAPRWLNPRTVVGVVLVLGSIVLGARLANANAGLTAVYVAAHDLVPGEHVTAADLTVAHVRLAAAAGRYVAAGAAPPVGYVVTRFVARDELVPAAALRAGPAAPQSRLVTVPVQVGHLPDGLARGSLVDVYVTPRSSGGGAGEPRLVLRAVAVEDRSGGSSFTGSATVSVVLAVPAADVAAAVAAVEQGAVDLVVVPPAEAP